MKILIYTDNHFCENSSIIRGRGAKYTRRLENQIASLNWAESLAVEEGCEAIVCLGDFFDKPNLTDEELTALRDVEWAKLPHYFVVGNHESSVNGLAVSSTMALQAADREIVASPKAIGTPEGVELCFLPYVIESDRKSVSEYFGPKKPGKHRVIFSHNDIKGIQLGPVVSTVGFELSDFEENADLTLNGHLHNGQRLSDKVVNVGNLTGQNFSEDAMRYGHYAMVLDVDTLKLTAYENPHAFNFYKIEIGSAEETAKLDGFKPNAVVTVKCASGLSEDVRKALAERPNVIESRLISVREAVADECAEVDFSVDHIAKFIECAREHYGSSPALEAELAEVCK